MNKHDVYIRSLHLQYLVNRLELMVFTIIFILTVLVVPVSWIINHVYHDFRFGWMLAVVAAILGLAMATHCGNTLQVLKRVTSQLNEAGEHPTFDYDQGRETDRTRYVITLIGKIIACLILLWCFTPWPQL